MVKYFFQDRDHIHVHKQLTPASSKSKKLTLSTVRIIFGRNNLQFGKKF